MITVDLTSPGGAFSPAAPANTQEITTTFSITSGTATLNCTGATPFVSGDTGKYFYIKGPGSANPSGDWLFGTMTFVSSSQVTLSTNATKTLSSASAYMAWGNDDSAAVRAFGDWGIVQSDDITLNLGTGSKNFMFCTGDGAPRGGSFAWNLRGLTVQGSGSSQTKFIVTPVNRAFALGATYYMKSGSGIWSDPGSTMYTARLDSVAAGVTTVTCKVISRATLFSANTWALITGLDLQGSGQPPNPYLYEYVYITNVNTTTGVITFQTGLANAYLDTWPNRNTGTPGLEPDPGGPATLYVLDPGWNIEAIYNGFTIFNPTGQTHTKSKQLIFNDVAVTDGIGLIPTGGKLAEFYNCDLQYPMEVDKIADEVVFDACTLGQLAFQSSVNKVTLRNGCTTPNLNGTAKIMRVDTSTVIALGMGSTGFGKTESFITTGSTFTGALTYSGAFDDGNATGVLGTDYTMSSSGVLTLPKASRDYFLSWAVPGCRVYITGGTGGNIRMGPGFKVLSVYDDATNIYVQTDWPFTGGLQSWMDAFKVFPSDYIDFAASTVGTTDDSFRNLVEACSLGYRLPGSYANKTLTGETAGTETGSAGVTILPMTGGKLVSLKVNVTTPYTGAQATLKWQKNFGQGFVQTGADYATLTTWNPSFDLKTAGLRIITPSGVTGTAGTDSSLTLPDPNAFLPHYLFQMGTADLDIRTEYAGNPSVGPVFTVELTVNPIISIPTAVAPLRLRLRAA